MFSKFIESFFGLGLFVNAILFVPQIFKLYKVKNSAGFSLVTFLGFNLIQLFTIFHGYLHSDWLLTIGYTLSFISCGIVTFMIFIYKN